MGVSVTNEHAAAIERLPTGRCWLHIVLNCKNFSAHLEISVLGLSPTAKLFGTLIVAGKIDSIVPSQDQTVSLDM
jgi:hypothetical protein